MQSNIDSLQARIDSLQKGLDAAYKPGLGEFMSGIQVHHAKLWFAGKAGNWELAEFEIQEIRESLEDIQKYCTDRPEIVSISMIEPAIDSVKNAVQAKKTRIFASSFTILTNTCNQCHQATKHAFNVIQIPQNPPFSNQAFQKPVK
ncbi:hypothetical protein ACX0G9_30865 [Flavitalea flava]